MQAHARQSQQSLHAQQSRGSLTTPSRRKQCIEQAVRPVGGRRSSQDGLVHKVGQGNAIAEDLVAPVEGREGRRSCQDELVHKVGPELPAVTVSDDVEADSTPKKKRGGFFGFGRKKKDKTM